MSTCEQAGFNALYCDNRSVPSSFNVGAAVTAATYKACQDICTKDAKCKAYTYNPSTKNCTKKSTRQFIYQAGLQSGPVSIVKYWGLPPCTADAQLKGLYKCNAGISSNANKDAAVYKSTWQACQVMCNGDAKCKGWTWNPQGMCQKKTDATYFYNLNYLSGSRSAAGTKSPAADASTGTGVTSDTTQAPTGTPAPTPAPTDPPATDWWRQESPLGVEWWVVIAVGLLLLLLVGAAGMMMMMSMSG